MAGGPIRSCGRCGRGFYEVTAKKFDDMQMHVMEPSQNSADWYHFTTVHEWLAGFPLPLKVNHKIKAYYGSTTNDHTPQPTTDEQAQKPVAALFDSTVEVATEPTAGGIGAKQSAAKGTAGGPAVPIRYEASGLLPDEKVAAPSHVLLIDEIVSSLYLFGLLRLPSFLAAMFSTQVEIQGPSNVLFKVDLPAGQKFRAVMTLLPVEPFRQQMRFRAFTTGGVPYWAARLLVYFVMGTVNQDRQVWEHKLHVSPRNIVIGDGPFAGYGRWLSRFYSASSKTWDQVAPGSTDW